MLARVSEPRLSRDGQQLAFTLRQTDYDANRGARALWSLPTLDGKSAPRRLSAEGSNAWSPRWSADGRTLYFLSDRGGSTQVWQLSDHGGEAQPVTRLPLDVTSYQLSPDGRALAFTLDVRLDCDTLECTQQALKPAKAGKASGTLYSSLFVRHWDSWADGRHGQLFLAPLDADHVMRGTPTRISKGIDGDIPSRPFGDESDYAFSPDGRSVYFAARLADRHEAWSTNFDLYAVPADASAPPRNLTADNPAWDATPVPSADGRFLYYLATRRPGFEADRFAIMELDLGSGRRREVAADWDRSASGLALAADGRSLLTTADDKGAHPLFSIEIASGAVHRLSGPGNVSDFSAAAGTVVIAHDTLSAPGDLFRLGPGREARQLTTVNSERLKDVGMVPAEEFTFAGWNGDSVRGYVMRPHGYVPGRRYPVAMLIHGGPQGSWLDDFHYRWNPQVFAGAGYAVVAIDFHGSTGYGQAFTDAISGHWGDRPLEDLQKGWAAAQDQFAYLDGSRACALGASYGGYMINWIAGNWATPASGAWRCLVNHDGVFDNRMMYYATEELWFDEWENHGALPWTDAAAYEVFNPAAHVADWKTPMLVVHGALDFRIPLEQGLGAFTALQRRGISSQFLVFPDENHWVQKPQNSVQWHRTVLDWLGHWTGKAAD
ncbi:MAG: S9 family peptidase [Pseudomonadota bacterium]|nr:S9 family peptidase [Pseudomonadota bacterium]